MMTAEVPQQQRNASLNEIIHSALNLVRFCLGMEVAFVTEFKQGRRIFRHIASRIDQAPIKAGDSHPLEESYCQYIGSDAIPAIVEDSQVFPILKAPLDVTSTATDPVDSRMEPQSNTSFPPRREW